MTASAEGKLVSHAYQSPGIHLFNTTWCEPTANGTLIREHIDITAPCLLMKTTYKGAATAHKEMLKQDANGQARKARISQSELVVTDDERRLGCAPGDHPAT